MSQNWVAFRTIFLTVHGSQAFGMATAVSDLDLKGVCIPPRAVRDDLFHKFEQIENAPFVERSCQHLINPANPKVESVIYSLRKYVELTALGGAAADATCATAQGRTATSIDDNTRKRPGYWLRRRGGPYTTGPFGSIPVKFCLETRFLL